MVAVHLGAARRRGRYVSYSCSPGPEVKPWVGVIPKEMEEGGNKTMGAETVRRFGGLLIMHPILSYPTQFRSLSHTPLTYIYRYIYTYPVISEGWGDGENEG
jgi:hypothetical protein